MSGQLFTVGYQALTLETFGELLAREKIVTVCDIRYKPTSPQPIWRQEALKTFLAERQVKYLHVGSAGNPYFGKVSPLVKFITWWTGPESGRERDLALSTLMNCLERGNVLLLCACRQEESCHRKVVVEWFQQETGI